MDVLLCTASIWHMCTMSMDRYFTIRYPIRYGRNKTKKMMTLKITFVWIISFAVSAPLAIGGFVDYENVYDSKDGSCVPSIENFKNFRLYGSIFAFYVPLIIMVTTYTLTIRILRQNRVLMSGLQGRYHFQVSSVGDRHRTGHRRLSKIGESRMSCPDLSPPRSDFTLTSVGLTSPKGSSGESAMSPVGERRGGFNPRNRQQPQRTQVLKVNLTDEANYVNCNFDPMFLKHMESKKEGADHHHRKQTLATRLKALSPKHSKSRTLRRGSQPNTTRSRIDTDDEWNPSVLLFRISRYYSDSNLTSLESDYSPGAIQASCSISDEERRPNGTTGRSVKQDQVKTNNGAVSRYPGSYFAPTKDRLQAPTSLRLASSSSTGGNDFDERHADFESSFMCFKEGEMLKKRAPSSMTTQTSTIDTTSAGTSPFPVDGAPPAFGGGRYPDTFQLGRSWTLSTADGRGLEEKQRNGRELAMNDGFHEPPTPHSPKTGQHSNGSARRGALVSATCKEDEEEELDEVRGLLVTPTRRKGTPRPSMEAAGSWNRGSPTSPSSSESRTVLRARFNLGRTTRKCPSACARKIGLLSKSRTNNERKASKVLGIIFAVFVLSWTPFFTINIVSVIVCDNCMVSITAPVMASMVWLGYLSSLANPIIYTMFSTSFRTVFYRILTCQYNQAVGCRGGHRASLQSSEERYLCWSKSGRSSGCLKDFGCESKNGGI